MRFEVLGPMRVTDGRGTRPVAGVRQRILLGALLAHANQPIPVERLAEIVWDGAPPGRAVPTLRTYVARLRQDLEPDAASRILTRDGGYLAEVAPGELDALAFETLCRDTGSAVRAADWARVSDHAARALALWRGAPLGDVPSQVLRDAWLPRLDQQHVQVTEWRIDAELHLGRHEHLVPQLRQLTADHPLHEHFHAQLMQALARCGRQAEALAAYRDARTVLVEELGIEPGPELEHLHERILAGDGGLAAPSAAPSVRPLAGPVAEGSLAAAVPRQLPAAAGHFTGRGGEMDLITGLHEASQQANMPGGTVVISAIDGMAGVGKTALAVRAAHRLADRFPDGQLFIDLHGYTEGHSPREPAEALGTLLRSLGVPAAQIPAQFEECASLYRQRLAGTRTLILLDNAVSEAQVRPLLPGGAGCLLLVTSRRRLKGLDDAHVLSLDVLPLADAIALLRTVGGPERAAADDPLLAEIAGLCGRLPLALRIAGALLRHRPTWTVAYLAGLLRDQRQRISALSDGERDLGAVFELSCRSLPGAEQQLFRLLGLIPGPDLDAYAAAALAGTDPGTAARMLEDLTDHNLLLQHTPGRYLLHDLIRLHARALAGQDPDRDAALNRLLDYYQHTARRADTLIASSPRAATDGPAAEDGPALTHPDAARAWLRAERHNLLAVLEYVTTHARRERQVALTACLVTLLLIDGPWPQAIELHAAAADVAGLLGDQPGRACALVALGEARRMTGDFRAAAADLEQALLIYRDLDQRDGQAHALTVLGKVRALTGDLRAAAADLEQALLIYRDLDQQHGQADALAALGDIRRGTGDLRAGAGYLEQALLIYRDLDQRDGQANALAALAQIRALTGDFLAAAADLEQALRINRDLGKKHSQANVLVWLSEARVMTGDAPGAVRAVEEAIQIFKSLGAENEQACAIGVSGWMCLLAGDLAGAARRLEAAIEIFRRLGACGNQAWALNVYGLVITAVGDYPRARAVYHEALGLARQTHQPNEEALALEGTGECHLRAGNSETGAQYLEQALEIFRHVGLKPDADRVVSRLTKLLPRTPPDGRSGVDVGIA